MKNVLFITYSFPPVVTSGTQRPLSFVKHLPSMGWNPIVLTVDKADKLRISGEELLSGVPPQVSIYRSKILELYDLYRLLRIKKPPPSDSTEIGQYSETKTLEGKIKNLIRPWLIPDEKIGWYPFAVTVGKKILKQHHIDVIFSTSPPATTHLIARTLAKFYQCPWIAEFRDPWTESYWIPKRPSFARRIDASWENETLTRADKIVTVMDGMSKRFVLRYPHLNKYKNKCKLTTIYNGYDEEDFRDLSPINFNKFTIIYTGILFKGKDPFPLLKGLQLIFKENEGFRSKIQVIFIGNQDSYTIQMVKNFGLEDVVKLISYLPHREALRYLMGAHLCYFNTIDNAMSGKIFEYLRSGNPILALINVDNEPAQLIQKTGSGTVINPDDTERIKNTLSDYYTQYIQGDLSSDHRDRSFIQNFERRKLTQTLANIFDQCLNTNLVIA